MNRDDTPCNPVFWIAVAIALVMVVWPAAVHSSFLYFVLFVAVVDAIIIVARSGSRSRRK